MALTFNFAALPVIKVFGFPVLATLAAGVGTAAAYVVEPANAAKEIPPVVSLAPAIAAPAPDQVSSVSKTSSGKPCAEQAWPYIEHRCMVGSVSNQNVRMVIATRNGEASSPAADRQLVSSDGVLRGPGVAPEANQQPSMKKEPKRSEGQRRTARTTTRDQRIVVRPLPVYFTSRF